MADQRKLAEQRIDGDRLSSLPDEILSHILSSLETKYAVRTAILSRRWKDLWTRVSNLDLVNSPYFHPSWNKIQQARDLAFSRFVDKVMSQHENLNFLRRLRLHSSMNCKVSPSFWCKIELESTSLIEEIDVRPSDFYHVRWLPESFYTLRNLKVLKLDGVLLTPVPESVHLPSLKILHLLSVRIPDGELLARLLSGCPVIETVRMEYSRSVLESENQLLDVSLPSLKNLTIIWDGGYVVTGLFFVIEAPCLEHFHLEDFEKFPFSVSRELSSSLVSASIDTRWNHEYPIVEFLTQISNVEELSLSCRTLSLLAGIVKDVKLPLFPKLRRLTLGCGGSSYLLRSLLDSSSQLRSIVIRFGGDSTEWEEFELAPPTPECLLSSLEEIEINDLAAFGNRMKVVAYLLKAGVVLKKLNVRMVKHERDSKKDLELFASVLKLPKGSSACEARLFRFDDEIHIDSSDENGIWNGFWQ